MKTGRFVHEPPGLSSLLRAVILEGQALQWVTTLLSDSGNPNVRERSGACGNVSYGEIRNPLHKRKGACRKLSA
jgi:hypothetical protein